MKVSGEKVDLDTQESINMCLKINPGIIINSYREIAVTPGVTVYSQTRAGIFPFICISIKVIQRIIDKRKNG